MVLKILSGDIQIADVMVPLIKPDDVAKLSTSDQLKYEALECCIDRVLSRQKAKKRGGKATIDRNEFETIQGLVSELYPKRIVEPGGSSANTLTTLKRLLGNAIDAKILGVIGTDGPYDEKLRDGLNSAKVDLISPPAGDRMPESATSFVFQEPNGNGKRTIFTYYGNAKDIIGHDVPEEAHIEKADVLFVQGSMWKKFFPDMANDIMKKRWGQKKELWLALPTQTEFDDWASQDHYRFIIPSADVVLGNADELMRVYEIHPPKLDLPEDMPEEEKEKRQYEHRKPYITDALHKLQLQLSERDSHLLKELYVKRHKAPVALITDEGNPAHVVTGDSLARGKGEIVEIPVAEVSGHKYLLGAGDTSFAGFLAGHIAGLDPVHSAHLAMKLAGAKLQFQGARMLNPRERLQDFSPAKRDDLFTGEALLAEVDKKIKEIVERGFYFEPIRPGPEAYHR